MIFGFKLRRVFHTFNCQVLRDHLKGWETLVYRVRNVERRKNTQVLDSRNIDKTGDKHKQGHIQNENLLD